MLKITDSWYIPLIAIKNIYLFSDSIRKGSTLAEIRIDYTDGTDVTLELQRAVFNDLKHRLNSLSDNS